MSWSTRRAILVLAAVAALGVITQFGPVYAQKVARRPIRPGIDFPPGPNPNPNPKPNKNAFDLGSLMLPKNDDLTEEMERALDNIRAKEPDWKKACEVLQDLISREKDFFVPLTVKDSDGHEVTAYVPVKKKASLLMSTLPKIARQKYETLYGDKAASMVKSAKTNNDARLMAQAMGLYLYTEAGAEAANWLGTYMLDRGDFRGAASLFQMLINRDGIKVLSEKTLLKAAYAFHQAGVDTQEGKVDVFKELERRGAEVKLRDEKKSIADLREYIESLPRGFSGQNAIDVPMYRGKAGRSAVLAGGTPLLEPTWSKKTIVSATTEQQVKTAEKLLTDNRNQPILPSFHPVTATITTKAGKQITLLVYRNYKGIQLVNLADGKPRGHAFSAWSMDGMNDVGKGSEPNRVQALSNWVSSYNTGVGGRPNMLFENSVLGSFSSDGKRVFAIDDLAVAPINFGYVDPWRGLPAPVYPKEITDAVHHNKLQAYDLAKGCYLTWELGGRGAADPMPDTYFLGPPLPMGDRLYVLAEKEQELKMVCVEASTGRVMSQQPLASVKDLKLYQNPYRRSQAAHLAYGEGVLVIPTNAGAVFGLDLLSNSLVWAYPYREPGALDDVPPNIPPWGGRVPPPWIRLPDGRLVKPGTDSQWKVTAPVVQDGKVVFTAPDAKSVHCINLRDGSPVWTQPRQDDDLYLGGVYNGKVLIVGKSRTRALSLTKGNTLWELETGFPSGQGAACPLKKGEDGDSIYYLPLRAAARTGKPEICAINVDRGIIHAHVRSRKNDVPGNLIFHEGSMVSQGTQSVIAYPQLDMRLAELDAKIKSKPADLAERLTERGDYLLDKGDLGPAIADFREALKNDPKPATKATARAFLYDALTEYFQRDFNKAEKYIPEYEELCKVDLTGAVGAERTARMLAERRRKANFLCLVGKGREAQNRLVDAFEKYLELGVSSQKDELIQVVDEPSVKAAPDVWSQGRIASMVANAKDPEQKKALENEIIKRWKKVKATDPPNVDELRNFVKMFGSLFGVGKEARLALAERLMDDNDLNSLLEAEQQLALLRGPGEKPEIAARAVEALARLHTRKGLLEDAAFYYRQLGQKYPKVEIEKGRTGSDYLEDLESDKRFWPYLEKPTRFQLNKNAKISYSEKKESSSENAAYRLHHSGEEIPFFTRNRLAVRFPQTLLLTDSNTGEEKWNIGLSQNQFQNLALYNSQPHRTKFGFQNLGHLVVFQAGHMVFAVDPLNKGRVLWEKNLAGAGTPSYSQLHAVDDRDGSIEVIYPDGWRQRVGDVGPLHGSVVCLLTRDSLTAVDPVTGRTLWTRNDVNSKFHVFGDEENIYAVGIGEDSKAMSSRAFRAYDGVSVGVRDFAKEYQNRLRMLGRNILVSDTDVRGVPTLRIYDVLAGKDLWKQKFPAKSLIMKSDDPRWIGIAEPTGDIRVIDLATTKEIFTAKLKDPKHLAEARSIQLLADKDMFYVAVDGPPAPNMIANYPVQPMIASGLGIRSAPVNGQLYAFDRKTAKAKWHEEIFGGMLILSNFEDMPVILLASHYWMSTGDGPAKGQMQKHVTFAIQKNNGKTVYENEDVPAANYYRAVNLDPRTGTVELKGDQLKVTLSVAKGK
jgi:outer membrane protein assembly factor BamB/tetratricopeptide (TPR) repeat protein